MNQISPVFLSVRFKGKTWGPTLPQQMRTAPGLLEHSHQCCLSGIWRAGGWLLFTERLPQARHCLRQYTKLASHKNPLSWLLLVSPYKWKNWGLESKSGKLRNERHYFFIKYLRAWAAAGFTRCGACCTPSLTVVKLFHTSTVHFFVCTTGMIEKPILWDWMS